MLTHEQRPLASEQDSTSSIVGEHDDLATLSLLTEDILLEHLKQRYARDLIYVSRPTTSGVRSARFLFPIVREDLPW